MSEFKNKIAKREFMIRNGIIVTVRYGEVYGRAERRENDRSGWESCDKNGKLKSNKK